MLKICNLIKSYASSGKINTILMLENFNVHAGEKVCIHGASGSGKTTLLNIIAGLVTPDSGEVRILDTDIFSLKENERDRFRADKIGYIFQEYNLFPDLTVIQNVMLPMSMINHMARKEAHIKADSLLEIVGLSKKHNQKTKTLSGGEKQRVAIARCLASNPCVILADEPTGNLDLKTGDGIMSVLRKSASKINAALIVVSHDTRQFSYFDKVINFEEINTTGMGGQNDS